VSGRPTSQVDPPGRLTWWNSGTDGDSPDGRQHAGRRRRCGVLAASPASAASTR